MQTYVNCTKTKYQVILIKSNDLNYSAIDKCQTIKKRLVIIAKTNIPTLITVSFGLVFL